jgi:hypothetical protein
MNDIGHKGITFLMFFVHCLLFFGLHCPVHSALSILTGVFFFADSESLSPNQFHSHLTNNAF